MDENIKYYVVKQKALPEVLLKVAQANRLIETKGISVADATALAGGDRIFRLLDEKPEVDDGYVTLTDAVVNADGTITESNKRTGTWAWKHYHKAEGTTDYRQLKGDVVFEHVDFGYNDNHVHSLV